MGRGRSVRAGRAVIRRLTPGERSLARGAFGDAIQLDPVRLIASPWPFDRAFVPGRIGGRDWIVWPGRMLAADLSGAPLSWQALLIHELVHVWQGQQGVSLPVAKLKSGDGPAAYAYPLDATDWRALNIEQQAMAVEHRFRLARGGRAPCGADFYDRLCPFLKPSVSALPLD